MNVYLNWLVLSQYTSITLSFPIVFNGGWSSMSLYIEKGLLCAPSHTPGWTKSKSGGDTGALHCQGNPRAASKCRLN